MCGYGMFRGVLDGLKTGVNSQNVCIVVGIDENLTGINKVIS